MNDDSLVTSAATDGHTGVIIPPLMSVVPPVTIPVTLERLEQWSCMFAHFDDYRLRRESFDTTGWSALCCMKFARAGFFYGGTDDIVICFYCGFALCEWPGTIDAVDPISEHKFWRTRPCAWADMFYARANHARDGPKPAIRDVRFINYLSTVRNTGASLRRELDAHRMLSRLLSDTYASVTRTLSVMIQHWELTRVIVEKLSYAHPVRHVAERIQMHEELTNALNGITEAASQHQHDHLLKGETQTTVTSMECTVCYEYARNCLLLPCRHFITCTACTAKLHTCPVCRANIWIAIPVRL